MKKEIGKEVWKDIEGFDGLYKVSNFGNVRSLHYGKDVILKKGKSLNFYYTVALSKNGKSKTHKIHSLVANAFIGKSDLHVNHKDGNKLNNHISNLEYVSARDNKIHSDKFKNSNSKYTGITQDKTSKKWRARITINGKRVNIGSFTKELDAYNAYIKAMKDNNIESKYA